ncbi:MAG: hypothetical protein IT357_09935 [Gemmatimonadaceae bacterium]|nr:hypothetical protein [Gemmatimonadaceae bacterium]
MGSKSIALALALAVAACSAAGVPDAGPVAQDAAQDTTPATAGCLASGDGYLRARMRGALDLDIDWRNGDIECTGGQRPDGSGLRVAFAGPLQSDGRRLRFVFGIGQVAEGVAAQGLPTNLTVIFEGERRLFATQGDDKCTVDSLTQQRTGPLGGKSHSWRVEARGFCIEPASTLQGTERLLVTRFDFAGRIDIEGESPSTTAETHAT